MHALMLNYETNAINLEFFRHASVKAGSLSISLPNP